MAQKACLSCGKKIDDVVLLQALEALKKGEVPKCPCCGADGIARPIITFDNGKTKVSLPSDSKEPK